MVKGLKAIAIAMLGLSLAGCSMGAPSGSNQPTTGISENKLARPKKDAVKIEDIPWKVEPGVDNGERRMQLSFENNSKYEIVGMTVRYEIKPDVTAETISQVFAEDINDYLSVDNIMDHGNTAMVYGRTQPGEESPAGKFDLLYLDTPEKLDCFEAEMITIMYRSGDKLYAESYDPVNKAYGIADNSSDIDVWSKTDLAKMLPRPSDEYVYKVQDEEDEFEFWAVGTTQESFEAYVEECKEAGFTEDAAGSDGSWYQADSEDGAYELHVARSYEGMWCTLSVKDDA